jgi:hypothetical protein
MIERPIEGKSARRFPTRQELVNRLVNQGLAKDEQDLLMRRPDLAGDTMLNWIQATQPGCLYATHLAKHRDKAGWLRVVMPRPLDDDKFKARVDGVLCPPPNDEMVMFIFPWVATPEDLADVIAQIGGCTGWSRVDPISLDGAGPDELLIGLRWLLPSGEAESWVLGFAPFDFMPFTRRAPYAAIVMRTLDPPDWQHRPEADLVPVHLAQVPHFFGDRGAYKGEIWTETEQTRIDLLGGELTHVARARVSFALPRWLDDRARPRVSSSIQS